MQIPHRRNNWNSFLYISRNWSCHSAWKELVAERDQFSNSLGAALSLLHPNRGTTGIWKLAHILVMVRRSSATPTFLGISSAHAHCCAYYHSRPQRLRSIWPAPWIETSVGKLCMGTYITYLRLDPWRWPNGSQPLGTRMNAIKEKKETTDYITGL